MNPPIWLDAAGRPRPTRACWTCGREVAPMRFRAEDLLPHGWRPTEYLPVPTGDGWWHMVPIWDPGQTANPLPRYEPAAPR